MMKIKKIILSIILIFCLQAPQTTFANNSDTTEVLLIGSSYFNYNNLKNLIQGLADSSSKNVYIEMCGPNGLYLYDHAQSPATEAKINERDWDYIVLQGVGVLVAYPNHFTEHPVYEALEVLRDKITANCESTRMVFCLPWAFEDGMTWYQNWTDTYEDMQWHIYDTTLQYSDEIGFEIAPVGWAWYGVLDANNYPLHYLHMSDWNHPSLQGSYLMACVIYVTIFQESVVNNSFNAGLDDDEVILFQTVASDTVLQHLELWNISPLVSISEANNPGLTFKLEQNYPNPYTSHTFIPYTLNKDQLITLSVYNAEGVLIAELLNQSQHAGHYKIRFDARGIAPGLYHYTLRSEFESQTSSMIHIY